MICTSLHINQGGRRFILLPTTGGKYYLHYQHFQTTMGILLLFPFSSSINHQPNHETLWQINDSKLSILDDALYFDYQVCA